jgi:hypothetical protein
MFGGILVFVTLVQNAQSQNLSDFKINGYGGWGFGITDGNGYQYGQKSGEFSHVDFALAFSVDPYEDVKVIAQVNWEDDIVGFVTQLEHAFAEWKVSKNLRLRFGRIRKPFGVYAEQLNVGTARPFLLLPLGLYGPQGFTAKAYNGAGLAGRFTAFYSWRIQYDLYFGQLRTRISMPGLLSEDVADQFEKKVSGLMDVEETVGTRIIIMTPFRGLNLGLSAWSGNVTLSKLVLKSPERERGYAYSLHLDYLKNKAALRSEYAVFKPGRAFQSKAFYIEAAYMISWTWQLALRYDSWGGDLLGQMESPAMAQVLSHDDIGVGLNYWFHPNFAIKWALHLADGNRFAFPLETRVIETELAGGGLDNRTLLFQFGVQYSF